MKNLRSSAMFQARCPTGPPEDFGRKTVCKRSAQGGRKQPNQELFPVDTTNILSFAAVRSGLAKVVEKRLRKTRRWDSMLNLNPARIGRRCAGAGSGIEDLIR